MAEEKSGLKAAFGKLLDMTDMDEKLKEKTGIDLHTLDEEQLAALKKILAQIDPTKIDVASIAKKLGASESVVTMAINALKKD